MELLPLDDIPVDQFIGDTGLTKAFVTAVRQAGDRGSDAQAIMRRLVTLRTQGKLPRLRRAYFGRDPSAN